MDVQRAVTIILPDGPDLRATVQAFQSIQQEASPLCFNDGEPLRAVPLQHACYHALKGQVLAQMTITALRLVAGAYASANVPASARLPLSSGAGNAWRAQASP